MEGVQEALERQEVNLGRAEAEQAEGARVELPGKGKAEVKQESWGALVLVQKKLGEGTYDAGMSEVREVGVIARSGLLRRRAAGAGYGGGSGSAEDGRAGRAGRREARWGVSTKDWRASGSDARRETSWHGIAAEQGADIAQAGIG